MAKSRKILQLRKGLTREDLLKGTWLEKLIQADDDAGESRLNKPEQAALRAFLPVLDAFIAYVNDGNRASRKDVTSFFVAIENFCGIREWINSRIATEELTPTLLDKLTEDI